MKPITMLSLSWLPLALALVGCAGDDAAGKKEPASEQPAAPSKKTKVSDHVFLETQGDQRRVLIESEVCLRQGQLEQFLTKTRTKEHEAILVADVDARHIHAALQLARAEPGSPVQFQPKYQAARGTAIKVFVEYQDAEQKTRRVPAQQWIRSCKTKKDLAIDWVFAGSVFVNDPFEPNKAPFYAANDGTVICLSNFESALLDLPIESSQSNDDLIFEAHTERIPPVKTKVTVILEPVPAKAKDKGPDKK